jgi:hypothetical protein
LTGFVAAPAAQPAPGQPAGAAPTLAGGQPPAGGSSLLGLGTLLGPGPASGGAGTGSTAVDQLLGLVTSLPVVEPVIRDVVGPLLSSPLLQPVVLGLSEVVDALPSPLGLGPVLSDLVRALDLPLSPSAPGPASAIAAPAGSGGTGAPDARSFIAGSASSGHVLNGQGPGSPPALPDPTMPANGGGGAGAAFAAGNALLLGWAAMFVAVLVVAGLRRLRPGAPRPLPRILFVSLTQRPG